MKTLGVYFSKTGVTEDVMIKLKVDHPDFTMIDLKTSKEIDLTPYQQIIIGTPIYMNHVPSIIKKFINKNLKNTENKVLYMYFCGGETPKDFRELLKLSGIDETFYDTVEKFIYCGGELRIEKLGFFSRLIVKMVTKHKQKTHPEETGMPTLNQENIDVLKQRIQS